MNQLLVLQMVLIYSEPSAPEADCLQPPLVPRSLRAFALASAGNFFSLIETKLREGQLSYGEVGAYWLADKTHQLKSMSYP